MLQSCVTVSTSFELLEADRQIGVWCVTLATPGLSQPQPEVLARSTTVSVLSLFAATRSSNLRIDPTWVNQEVKKAKQKRDEERALS